ncbi:MAG TPA: NRDE family protein, partial [bacterium]|nr:NRDE family protein [bacterium]
ILNSEAPDADVLLDIMTDREAAPDKDLPDTGVGVEWERKLSPVFIQSPNYGTRATTIYMEDRDGNHTWIERVWDPALSVFTFQRYAWGRTNE